MVGGPSNPSRCAAYATVETSRFAADLGLKNAVSLGGASPSSAPDGTSSLVRPSVISLIAPSAPPCSCCCICTTYVRRLQYMIYY